ncbi:MAG: zinc ribbon domain-containing protein [Chlamydiales bacterium]|nr:zinc ribbon domain-containing protein [Chlamydiia bacterium]MCP5507614.1 zinc ribbon domain-containing protein [Chlamydiales bacterium]
MQQALQDSLKTILEVQELDMQMIQLMRLKNERQKELDNINAIKKDLQTKVHMKESEIFDIKTQIRLGEGELEEIKEKIQKLEQQQNAVKKVDEFNALSHEMSAADKQRAAKEQILSDLYDQQVAEEDLMKSLKESLESTSESSKVLEAEIHERITKINHEGRELKEQRDSLVANADPEVFAIYERLLRNKKDRVVVPIENRCCSGCHITITAQHENIVRKGERLIFCEHCSRIHYWQEGEVVDGTAVATRRRRRTRTTT